MIKNVNINELARDFCNIKFIFAHLVKNEAFV